MLLLSIEIMYGTIINSHNRKPILLYIISFIQNTQKFYVHGGIYLFTTNKTSTATVNNGKQEYCS